MITMKSVLDEAVSREASDVHFTIGQPIQFRVEGVIEDMNEQLLSAEEVSSLANEILNSRTKKILDDDGETDFAYTFENTARLRCNVYKESGLLAMAIRVLPVDMPTVEVCQTPTAVVEACNKKKGLILVTGPTGHGKSTTLAALINYINETSKRHIITLEDPIEYVHTFKMSIIHQREVGLDTKSFAAGLRAALRQDPDVVLVGEMRDLETISTAISAAETGHLVLGTLHTNTTAMTVDRIIDAFPAEQQEQIRIQLSNVLECIICQSLVPTLTRKRVAAYEVMTATNAIRNLIRENKTFQLTSMLQTGRRFGMITMDDYLIELYKKKTITLKTAIDYSGDADAFRKKLNSQS